MKRNNINRLQRVEEKRNHLLRLNKLGYAKVLYKVYKPSRIQLNILRWFGLHSAQKIANKLEIDKSYVYAVIEKFKKVYTKEELK